MTFILLVYIYWMHSSMSYIIATIVDIAIYAIVHATANSLQPVCHGKVEMVFNCQALNWIHICTQDLTNQMYVCGWGLWYRKIAWFLTVLYRLKLILFTADNISTTFCTLVMIFFICKGTKWVTIMANPIWSYSNNRAMALCPWCHDWQASDLTACLAAW